MIKSVIFICPSSDTLFLARTRSYLRAPDNPRGGLRRVVNAWPSILIIIRFNPCFSGARSRFITRDITCGTGGVKVRRINLHSSEKFLREIPVPLRRGTGRFRRSG